MLTFGGSWKGNEMVLTKREKAVAPEGKERSAGVTVGNSFLDGTPMEI